MPTSDSRADTDEETRIGEKQLEALQALAEFEDIELRALRELAQDRASDYVNRRSLIKSAGTLTGMGIAGSVGYNEGVQQARAADTSAGDVGVAGSPVDIYLDEIRDPGGDPVADLDDTGTWSFNRGVSFPSVDTDELATVEGTTLADIANAVENGPGYVKLRPNTTYTGSTIPTVDLSGGRHVYVDARGATVDASARAAIECIGGNLGQGDDGSFTLLGGTWKADGTAGSAAIDIQDTHSAVVRPHMTLSAEHGIYVHNESGYCEGGLYALNDNYCTNGLTMHGASTTGGTGTDSFANTRALISGHCNGGAVVNQATAGAYGANFWIRAFCDYASGSRALTIDGSQGDTRYWFTAEDPGDSQTSTEGIVEGAGGVFGAPLFEQIQFKNIDTELNLTSLAIGWDFDSTKYKQKDLSTSSSLSTATVL